MVRFVLVGVLNTIFGYATFATLTAMGCSEAWAVPGAMLAGVLFNFVTYGKVVYESLDQRRIPRFAMAYLFVYGCDIVGLRVLERSGLDAYHAQFILALPLAATMYLLNDRWVFHGV